MYQNDQENNTIESDKISLKEVVLKIRIGVEYIKAKWVTIILLGILGGLTGLAYSIYKKPTYTAVCTFVLDEGNRTAGLGQYAELASLAGFSLGGGGIFQGDNIIQLYQSRFMIENALLRNISIDGKNELLIDRYITFNKLRDNWKKKDNIDSITFTGNPEKFNRKQDSLITNIVGLINKSILKVTKPDKKLRIIQVEVTSKDEIFAKEFTTNLVNTVNDFYVKTLTKKSSQDVTILQRQADSIKNVLNSSISGVASAMDAAPNANPALISLRVPSQKKQVDVQASGAIYAQIEQSLEIAKITLMRSTPLIQVIDQPVYPLEDNHSGKLKSALVGALFIIFFYIVFLLVRKFYQVISSLW